MRTRFPASLLVAARAEDDVSQVTRDRIYSEFAGLRKKVLASPLDQRSEFVPVGGHRSMARPQPLAVRIFLFIVSATDTFHVRETTCWWVDTVPFNRTTADADFKKYVISATFAAPCNVR